MFSVGDINIVLFCRPENGAIVSFRVQKEEGEQRQTKDSQPKRTCRETFILI